MKAVVHANGAEHQQRHAEAMLLGLRHHGVDAVPGAFDEPEPCDFAVVWGLRQRRVFAAGRPVLVMERGHVADRMQMASCGWNGLGRRGLYPTAVDGGARWRRLYGHLMQPWRYDTGYALVIGQVEGDAALRGLDVNAWADETMRHLIDMGWPVVFRPHPLMSKVRTTLDEDLRGAGICVTYNSTAGVEAVLAGVPTVTLDPGAMAWPVTSHQLGLKLWTDREAWAHDLAFTQWGLDEIERGYAWAFLGPLLETACPASA